jgi:sensor histidine kinase YesM
LKEGSVNKFIIRRLNIIYNFPYPVFLDVNSNTMATRRLELGSVSSSILLHLLFWIFIVTYFAWGIGLQNPVQSFKNASFFLPGFIVLVYTLLYFLVPKYLLPRKFLYFFIGLFVILAVCLLYINFAQLTFPGSFPSRGMKLAVGANVLPFIHVAGIALSIKLLTSLYQQKNQTLEAEKQKSEAELQCLKAQLHPHFLFNTLNNLYAHTLESSPRSPEIVMKLSELLRFMIYESKTPKIPLNREIQLIENYIALETYRYGDRLDLSVSISGDVGKFQIAPLLLLPFLENAFKHGTSMQLEQCWINLNLYLEGSVMYFKLVNSIEPEKENESPAKVGGLGLMNVSKRLGLLYKDRYNFIAKKMEEVFVVDLVLNLEPLEDKYAEMEMYHSG